MGALTRVLARLLVHSGGLLPPGRRQWVEAAGAEAGEVAAVWPRLRWLGGGLWLVAREAKMARKIVYWLGAGAVAAVAAWVVWLTWRTYVASDPQTVTDRVRVLVGVAALVVLPWVGRRRGWFGPVGSSITARLVRVVGCAAVCGLGLAVVRMDSQIRLAPHDPGPFSLPREIVAVALIGVALAARPVGKALWPHAEPMALWAVPAIAGLIVFFVLPVQALAVLYVAGILAATSQRSPATNVALAAGAIAGLAAGAVAALTIDAAAGDDSYVGPIVLGMLALTVLFGALAGVAAAWPLPGTTDPQKLKDAQLHQGLLAGSMAGAACGLLLTNLFVVAFFMLVIGPVVGGVGGVIGGEVTADHLRRSQLPAPEGGGSGAPGWG